MSTKTTEKLNRLLRGERSAAETYKQALSKVGADPRADHLRTIQAEHFDAVLNLKKHVELRGDDPETSSGPWGAVAKTVMVTAKLFGDKATLKALKEGEEHGLKDYQELANDEEIDPQVKTLVSTILIPRTKSHIEKIASIIKTF